MKDSLKLKDIYKASTILKNGGVVIFPTDTVWGIGCRFDDKKAIERIYQMKKTPNEQKFPILVSNVGQVKKIARVTRIGQHLIRKYWPGALTIIMPAKKNNQEIGFRMPNHKLVLDLIEKADVAIIGTSANFHGEPSPKRFEDLDPALIKLADFTLRGHCHLGVESTVIDITVNPPKILRKGTITSII